MALPKSSSKNIVLLEEVEGHEGYYYVTTFGPASPPDRPHPEPEPPWAPPDPDKPWTKPGPGKPPIQVQPIPPSEPNEPVTALVMLNAMPVPPPASFPADAASVKIWHGKGTVAYDWWLPATAVTKPNPVPPA